MLDAFNHVSSGEFWDKWPKKVLFICLALQALGHEDNWTMCLLPLSSRPARLYLLTASELCTWEISRDNDMERNRRKRRKWKGNEERRKRRRTRKNMRRKEKKGIWFQVSYSCAYYFQCNSLGIHLTSSGSLKIQLKFKERDYRSSIWEK